MEKVRREKMQVPEKVGKSRNTLFFQCFVAPEGRKVGWLKRRVQRHLGRWEMKNCTQLWREAHFEVKSVKARRSRSTFGSWDVEKVHGVVARSTFGSENVQSTPCSNHFWKLRCWKSERRCGAKHIWKWTCTKHLGFGPLFDDSMAVRCQKRVRKHVSKSKVSKLTVFSHFFNDLIAIRCQQLQLQLHLQLQQQQLQLLTTIPTTITTTTTTLHRNALQLPLPLELQLQVHFNYNYNSTPLPPTTCWSMSGFALRSISHSNQPPIVFLSLKLPPPPCAVHNGMSSGWDIISFEFLVREGQSVRFALYFFCARSSNASTNMIMKLQLWRTCCLVRVTPMQQVLQQARTAATGRLLEKLHTILVLLASWVIEWDEGKCWDTNCHFMYVYRCVSITCFLGSETLQLHRTRCWRSRRITRTGVWRPTGCSQQQTNQTLCLRTWPSCSPRSPRSRWYTCGMSWQLLGVKRR